MHYKEVCTATEQYKVVWYYSIVHTTAALCHTKYAPSLYSKVVLIAGLQRHCNVEVWECLGPNPVPSTYWVCTQYVLAGTQYVLSMYVPSSSSPSLYRVRTEYVLSMDYHELSTSWVCMWYVLVLRPALQVFEECGVMFDFSAYKELIGTY
jgi:hypothetical protein